MRAIHLKQMHAPDMPACAVRLGGASRFRLTLDITRVTCKRCLKWHVSQTTIEVPELRHFCADIYLPDGRYFPDVDFTLAAPDPARSIRHPYVHDLVLPPGTSDSDYNLIIPILDNRADEFWSTP